LGDFGGIRRQWCGQLLFIARLCFFKHLQWAPGCWSSFSKSSLHCASIFPPLKEAATQCFKGYSSSQECEHGSAAAIYWQVK
jgi:hypothetical protein